MTASHSRMAAVIVTYNAAPVIEDCLRSVGAAGPAEIVVVDNASSDATADVVRQTFPDVCLVQNPENIGYGAAANRGVRLTTTPYVLVLNPDVVVPPDALRALSAYLDTNPAVGVAGPRLQNGDGSLQRSTCGFPTTFDSILAETGLHSLVARVPWLRDRSLRTWAHDRCREVPCVLGAALAVRRSAFDAAGGFNESFFLYSEEVDLCRRLASMGLPTHYAPVTTVVHIGGASGGTTTLGLRRQYIRSKRAYLRRHASRSTAAGVTAVLWAAEGARLMREVLRSVAGPRARDPRPHCAVRERFRLVVDRDLWTG